MNLIPGNTIRDFNLLGIGCRGAGKTVFLAGTYAELQSGSPASRNQNLWFDCQNRLVKDNLDELLQYVAQYGKYPPPTIKITHFTFNVKCHTLHQDKTLCRLNWWDIPGETCNLRDPDFQTILLSSHGCCLFIDASALVHDPNYLVTLEHLLKQVEAIVSLAQHNQLKYPFALIFTKCDLLDLGPLSLLQLEEKLQPLITHLDAANADYQKFYSSIPIVSIGGMALLQATNASAPLLWMTSELRKLHRFKAPQQLETGLTQILSNSAKKASIAPGRFRLKSDLISDRALMLTSLAGLVLVAGIAFPFLGFGRVSSVSEQGKTPQDQIQVDERLLKQDPNNSEVLINLIRQHAELGQYEQAIPFLEQLVRLQPENLNAQFELAGFYALTNQTNKEASIYDQILNRDKNNVIALLNKAKLAVNQGDPQTAKTLFDQAEQVAPTSELKANVREVAQNALNSTAGANRP